MPLRCASFSISREGEKMIEKRYVTWTICIIVAASFLLCGIIIGGYDRAQKISSFPCLGCMALNPKIEGEFIFDVNDESPNFVLDALKNNVVFIHYRTDVCSACDDMEPIVYELEGEYTDVTFIHINLDHTTEIKEESYDVYDVKSKSPDKRTGVPMFVVITFNEDNGIINPFYKTFYGIHAKDHLSEAVDFAQQLFDEYKSQVKEKRRVLAELFVDQNCVHCPLSEEALMELYDEGEVYFISMITDADGISGLKAIEREDYYKISYGGGGHPRVDFDGGYRERMGADEQIKDVYYQYIQECDRSLPNITINVDMEEVGDNSGINISVQIHYLGEGTIQTSLRTYIVEKLSRWKNLDDDPIPFGFLDYAFDEDIILESNEWHNTSIQWNGTDALEYDVLNYNNLAVIAALFDVENNYTIQTDAYFPAAVRGVDISCFDKQINVLAGGNTSYEIVVKNTNLIPVIIDFEILKTKEWDTALSEFNISLDINETKTITLLVNAPLNAAIDETCNVTITAVIRGEEFKRDSITTTTIVKDDVMKPIIVDVYHTPEKPKMKDILTIHTKAGDNKGISSVKLSYFVCTEELCYPPIEVNMEKNINDYTAEIGPFENDYTTLHYKIIVDLSKTIIPLYTIRS
jgi:thiol-disulfide isomerase/thioredoxin